jgi:hypothetical protein
MSVFLISFRFWAIPRSMPAAFPSVGYSGQ